MFLQMTLVSGLYSLGDFLKKLKRSIIKSVLTLQAVRSSDRDHKRKLLKFINCVKEKGANVN